MGIEEKLPSGVLLTTVEGVAGYMRKASFWPATFGLACCAIEMMTTGGPNYDLARFGMEVFRASPRQADLMIVAGRVSQKMAPVLRQIYDQMAEPKWVLAMGVCASSGGMFNNYAIVQGVDHVVPVDMYLPGCPPRPEMLIDAILKLHDQVQAAKLGANRRAADRGARDRGAQRAADLRDEGPAAMSDAQDDAIAEPNGAGAAGRRAVARERPAHPTGTEVRSVGQRRRACSASAAPATPPATAAWSQPIVLPGASPAPYGGWFDEVADALEAAPRPAGLDDAIEKVVVHRGEITFYIRRERPARRGAAAARRRGAALRVLLRRQRRALPRRRRPRAARGLPPALDDPQPPDPARGHLPRRRPAHPVAGARSTRPTTGTSARPTTSSASSSTATRR